MTRTAKTFERGAGRTPIDPSCFSRGWFTGNPPHSTVGYGWTVTLGGRALDNERAWLRSHGYRAFGVRWMRPDRRPEGGAVPSRRIRKRSK